MINSFNSLNNSTNNNSNDKIICPKCSVPLLMNNSLNNFNINEFDKIICNKCYFEFCFIFCEYCSKKIYMKIN